MAEHDAHWETVGHERVWLGPTTQVPQHIRFVGVGLKGAPDLHAEFEIRDGVPEVTEFCMTAKPNGRGVRTSDLRAFTLDGFAYAAFMRFASYRVNETGTSVWDDAPSERDWWAMRKDYEDAAAANRRGPSAAELEDVARTYREHFHEQPTAAVAGLGYTRRTAARRIQQARAAGLLPPTTQGKRKA